MRYCIRLVLLCGVALGLVGCDFSYGPSSAGGGPPGAYPDNTSDGESSY